MTHIHNKAIFDAINEALDRFRPYGLNYLPPIWSKRTRSLTHKHNSQKQMEKVFAQIKSIVGNWSTSFCGALPNSELMRKKGVQCDSNDQLDSIKEERLALILGSEMEESESRFTNNEKEEASVKIDLASLVFDTVMQETVQVLQALGNRNFK